MLRRKHWITALALACAPQASPWGSTGHHIVALIAEQRLSPDVREKIRKLLGDGKVSLADVSTCADQLRGTPRNAPTPQELMCRAMAGEVPQTNNLWHYIDIPLPTKAKSLAPFCPNDNCVTARIQSFSDLLRTATDDAKKKQALLFLVHFMGDIHQPLHAIERGCDRGGNLERANFFLDGEKRPNSTLHFVWDIDELDLLMKHSNIADERAYASALAAQIKHGKASKWARATPDQIAWESYKLAKKYVYRGIPYQDFCNNNHPPQIVTDLTLAYEDEGTKVVHEQLMKAGVRLAAALENDLGVH